MVGIVGISIRGNGDRSNRTLGCLPARAWSHFWGHFGVIHVFMVVRLEERLVS